GLHQLGERAAPGERPEQRQGGVAGGGHAMPSSSSSAARASSMAATPRDERRNSHSTLPPGYTSATARGRTASIMGGLSLTISYSSASSATRRTAPSTCGIRYTLMGWPPRRATQTTRRPPGP